MLVEVLNSQDDLRNETRLAQYFGTLDLWLALRCGLLCLIVQYVVLHIRDQLIDIRGQWFANITQQLLEPRE